MEINFTENTILYLALILASVLILGWSIFFIAAMRTKENVKSLIDGTFLQNLTVILIVAAVSFLSLIRILPGEIVGSILSGIVGYVLGSIKVRTEMSKQDQDS
jgi:hypothetical protein